MNKFKMLDLFSGIGGFALAATWCWQDELEIVSFCEIECFPQKVLKKHWPDVPIVPDIKKLNYSTIKALQKRKHGKRKNRTIDILTGGFPCQPFSVAGKRKGSNDDRYLWPEMLRIIRETKPRWIIGENVAGLIGMENGETLAGILTGMENEGYEIEAFDIPASGVEAWHKRHRVWLVAHAIDGSDSAEHEQTGKEKVIQEINRTARCSREPVGASDTFYPDDWRERTERIVKKAIPEFKGISRGKDGGIYAHAGERSDILAPVVCRTYDGLPYGVDRVRGCGNAIVPQIAFEIMQAIKETDKFGNE